VLHVGTHPSVLLLLLLIGVTRVSLIPFCITVMPLVHPENRPFNGKSKPDR